MTTVCHPYEPPQSLEAEQSVLGAIIKDADALNTVVEILDDEGHFYYPKNRMIYETILGLYRNNEPCDITILINELLKHGTLDEIGGRNYLVDVMEGVASTAHVAKYAKIVQDKSIARHLIAASNQIIGGCYDQSKPIDELLAEAEASIFQVADSRRSAGLGPVHISTVMPAIAERVQNMQAGIKIKGTRETGLVDLDNHLRGLLPGDSIVVAGKTSHGKTQLGVQIAEHVGLIEKEPVTIFSIEMDTWKIGMRMVCDQSRLDSEKVKTPGALPSDDWDKFVATQARLSQGQIWVDDRATLTPMDIKSVLRRQKAQHGLGLVIVDYLQIMSPGVKKETRNLEVAYMSWQMKAIAKELNVPVVSLSQFSKFPENRKPCLSDLRDSGAVGQDADVVLFVYHDNTESCIIVGKNRSGKCGEIPMTWVNGRWENKAENYR